jgi:hypothetical protein
MVCSPEAQKEMAAALGLTATVSTPTWNDHTYACTYGYPNGSFTLSVKELSSWPQTYAFYNGARVSDAPTEALQNLGQAGFQGKGGVVVVRKEWKVLTVNVAGLPAQFGVPPTSADSVAVTVADVILACWAGG